jgi:hypothetical protein
MITGLRQLVLVCQRLPAAGEHRALFHCQHPVSDVVARRQRLRVIEVGGCGFAG